MEAGPRICGVVPECDVHNDTKWHKYFVLMDTDSQSPFVVGELKICLNGALPTGERGRPKECP